MCNRILILHKKTYQLLKPTLETKKGTINGIATHRDSNWLSVFEARTNCTMHPFNYSCTLVRLTYITMSLEQCHFSLSTQPTTTLSWVVLLFLSTFNRDLIAGVIYMSSDSKTCPKCPNRFTMCVNLPLPSQHSFMALIASQASTSISFSYKFHPFCGISLICSLP